MQIFRPKFLLVALAFWTAVCETQRLEANLYRVSIFLSYFTTLSSVRPLLSFVRYFLWESSNSGN